MKVLKVYVDDDFKELVDQTARAVDMNTSSFAGTLMREALAGIGSNSDKDAQDKTFASVTRKTSDHIKKKCSELSVTQEQYIDSLIYEKPEPVVVSPFLEDYKDEMSRIEEQIDSMCYYIAQNKYQLVSDDTMQSLHEKLDEIGTLFAAIYKKCSKEENLTINRMKGNR